MTRRTQFSWLAFVVAAASTAAAQQGELAPNDAFKALALSPRAFRAAAETIRPSLVRIEAFGGIDGKKSAFTPGEGPSTGLVISDDGWILTSTFNFLKQPPIITVVLADGSRKIAKLHGRDDTRKICLLKIDDAAGLAVPKFAPREELRVGQWVVAVGVGFGDREPALTAGIVSAVHRINDKAVQTDANLSPANYGGPLLDLEGRVVGICAPLSPQSSEAAAGAEWYDSGIGFAVPLAGLDKVLAALKEGKTLSAPFLGVKTKAVDKFAPGAEVMEVVKDSPAEKAGLKKGDVITKFGGQEALDPTHLSTLVKRFVAGDKAAFAYRRGEENLEGEVELTVPPPPPKNPKPMKPGPMPMPMPPQPPPS